MNSRSYFACTVAAALVTAFSGLAVRGGGIDGKWRGRSICVIKDSPCHDEQVVYIVSKPDSAGNLKIQMDKVIDGNRKLMGTLNCSFDRAASTITCPMTDKEWKFVVSDKKMEGTLTLSDGRLYRTISVTKD
jgi:hypothetical protein